MGDTTAIGWTDATYNPWMGCTKVSPGCAHCYMFRDQIRYGNNPELVRRSKTTFTNPLKPAFRKAVEANAAAAGRDRPLIFTCSWSDWFHEAADAWRDEAWDVIRRTPQYTYQILTKRPERIRGHLPHDWGNGYPNVWLGTSIENQRWTTRLRFLCDISAVVRFISAEPLLGPLSFGGNLASFGISWVIVGGESGADARPMDLDWARSIRDECTEAGVAYYLKQLGGHPDARAHGQAILDGRTWTEFPRLSGVVRQRNAE